MTILFFWPGLVNRDTGTIQLAAMKPSHGFTGLFLRFHFHESKAFRHPGKLIFDDDSRKHFADFGKIMSQVRFCNIGRKIPHIQIFIHIPLLFMFMPSGVFKMR